MQNGSGFITKRWEKKFNFALLFSVLGPPLVKHSPNVTEALVFFV